MYLIQYLSNSQTPIFVWCAIRCELENGHQEDLCLKEIGLCAKKLLTIVDSIVDIIEGAYLVALQL
jgi:hypothetical protein